jgi:flagellar motor switch protein FliM
VSCGGAPREVAAIPAREFSPVEIRLIERLAARILAELQAAWAPVASLECGLVQVETTPLFAAIATPEEIVVHVELAIVAAGLEPSTLTLVVPDASLDPIRPRLQSLPAVADERAVSADTDWAAALRARLLDVSLEVAVDLGTADLTLARLLELAVGDLVPLDVGRDGPVVVRVAGEPRFHGAPGVQGGNNAVRITERL